MQHIGVVAEPDSKMTWKLSVLLSRILKKKIGKVEYTSGLSRKNYSNKKGGNSLNF